MRPLRMLHLVASLGGGGAERQLAYVSASQQRAGHEPHVGTRAGGVHAQRLAALGERLHRLPSRSNHDPRGLSDLIGLIRRVRPDVVQTWLPMMDVLGGVAARLCGVPWILTEQASAQAYPAGAKTLLRLQVAGSAAAIVANSRAGERYWARSGPSEVPRYIIANGISFDELANAPLPAPGSVPPAPFFLFAGRLTGQKNLPIHLDALRRIPASFDPRLLVCGEGPDAPGIAAMIRADPVLAARVDLVGYREDLWSLMKAAAAFVSATRFEGQPNVVLEAMACGCPLIVSDIPEHREFLDAQCAWLVDPGDPDALALAMRQVLEHPSEARWRATNADARVRLFSMDAAVRSYDDVYATVVSRRDAGGRRSRRRRPWPEDGELVQARSIPTDEAALFGCPPDSGA